MGTNAACKVSVFELSLVRISPYSLRINTDRHGVSLRIQSKCGKMRTRKNPNTDTFHAVEKFRDKHPQKKV